MRYHIESFTASICFEFPVSSSIGSCHSVYLPTSSWLDHVTVIPTIALELSLSRGIISHPLLFKLYYLIRR